MSTASNPSDAGSGAAAKITVIWSLHDPFGSAPSSGRGFVSRSLYSMLLPSNDVIGVGRMSTRFLLLAGLLCCLSACATVESTVAVPYTAGPASRIAQAGPIAVIAVDGRTEDRSRISTKINAYGMDMAAIRSAKPVTDIVHDALAAEFSARGFQVEPSGLPVTVTVKRFYNQYHTGFWSGTADGEVILAVVVTDRSGASLFTGSFDGHSRMSMQLAGGSNAAQSVAAALHDAITRMFQDPRFVQAVTTRLNARVETTALPDS